MWGVVMTVTNEQIDYDFCKKAKLTPKDLLIWLGLEDCMDSSSDGIYSNRGAFFGRNLMIVDNALRVSCPIAEFDRWANSEEYWFDLDKSVDRRLFVEFVKHERSV